jgi:hypothetical protein
MAALAAALGLLGAVAPTAPASPSAARGTPRTLFGLAAQLPPGTAPAAEERAAAEVRASGVSLFSITVSWSECEPAPGRYKLDGILSSVRLLRQSGATVHLDLPLVSARVRDVPADLAGTAFDDPKLSLRLGRFLDALETSLLDASTISLGFAADTYFSDKPEELKAYRRLFDGAVEFLGKKAPQLKVGVTTAAPTESPAPEVAAALHQRSPLLLYLYAPFERAIPYQHRAPESVDNDWKLLLQSAAGKPIAFPEVSYSSATENGSTPEKQAEFVKRVRRFAASAEPGKILFVRYATFRDEPAPPPLPGGPHASSTLVAIRRASFLAHRGLETVTGEPKPAWREWLKGR